MKRKVDLKPGQRKLTAVQKDAERLFVLAKQKPDGFTYEDIEAAFEWEKVYFFHVVRELRLQLGENDTINLPCTPRGSGETWLYRLVGTHDEARAWHSNRINDMEARFETMIAVARSVGQQSVDSLDRRKARKIERTLSYLHDELAEISERV
jgi:hypothetical protein